MKEIKVKQTTDNVKPMDKKTKNKHEFDLIMKSVKMYLQNVEHFIETVCWLLVAGFTYYYSTKVGISHRDQLIFNYSAIVIGLRGGWEFVKTFKR